LTLTAESFDWLNLSGPAAREMAMVRGELEKLGRPVNQMNFLIAGHARSLGSTLVAANTRHFDNLGGLRVENSISSR
jgi:tRNA(fMet)-specific endonuclease VapC